MSVLKISELNVSWGICGFASALGALHENGIVTGAIDDAVSKSHLDTRLLAEIKSYLVLLKAENHPWLLGEITRFTRSFGGPYATFEIDKYIEKVNSIGANLANVNQDFSIAMPPNGVADYMRRMGEMKAVLVQGSDPVLNNAIVGLGDKTRTDEWRGLRHWVYRKSNLEIYNWGKKETIAEVMAHDPNWQIVYQVALGK